MKLSYLASFDSVHRERGVFGLTGASKLDAQIWNEYQSNWDQLALESQERFEELMGAEAADDAPQIDIHIPEIETAQDAAFDQGLITLDEKLRVVLSNRIREHMTHESIRQNFERYEGKAVTLPHRFRPDSKFLDYHRDHVFERRLA